MLGRELRESANANRANGPVQIHVLALPFELNGFEEEKAPTIKVFAQFAFEDSRDSRPSAWDSSRDQTLWKAPWTFIRSTPRTLGTDEQRELGANVARCTGSPGYKR